MVIEEKDDLDGLMVKWDFLESIENMRVDSEVRIQYQSTKRGEKNGHFDDRGIGHTKTFLGASNTKRRRNERERYEEDRLQLNLQPNEDGLLECRGRIQGHYPIYLPDNVTYTELEIRPVGSRKHSAWWSRAHHGQGSRETLHGYHAYDD